MPMPNLCPKSFYLFRIGERDHHIGVMIITVIISITTSNLTSYLNCHHYQYPA
jgi:hypothetical protein